MSGAGQWRPMREADLPAVVTISDAVHGDFTEPLQTFADRLAHYPAGCAILERDGAPLGYLISHLWPRDAAPPKLGALMGAIPVADSYWYAQGFAYVGAAIEGPYGAGSHLMRRAIEAA